MTKFVERSAEGTQERRRLSVSQILAVENLTGERTPLMRLYEQWRDNADLRGFSWIDVTADNPFNFVLHNHRGAFIGGGLSNLVLNEYPFRMHARSCAAEYWECKSDAQPVAHYVNQELDGRQREYVRLMIPVTEYGKIVKIVYAFRHFKPPLPFVDSPGE